MVKSISTARNDTRVNPHFSNLEKKNISSKLSFLLGSLLVMTSVILVGRMFYQIENLKRFWVIYTYADVIIFLFGPVIFFFTRTLLRKPALSRSATYWHLLPAALHLLVFNTYIVLVNTGQINDSIVVPLNWLFYVLEFTAIISLGIYTWKSIQLYEKYEVEHYESYSFPALSTFLKSFLYFFALLSVVWGLAFVLRYWELVKDNEGIGYYGFWTFAAISTYFLTYKILLHPEVLEVEDRGLIGTQKTEETANHSSDQELVLQKYALEQLMEETKIYQNPKLSLDELASAMDISRHELSRIINQGIGKTFFDMVNSYRIEEFIEEYTKGHNLTFLEVAYQVGFNSKSAFNRAFRKATKLSPSEYFKKQPKLQDKEI